MPRLTRSASYLPVADVARSAAEYRDTFGFTIDYLPGDPPLFAIVSRDGLPLMLRLVPDPTQIVPNERQGGTWDVFFWTDNADELFVELTGRGATVVYAPIDKPDYRMREFAVRDSTGYVLGFGSPLP